MSNNENFVTFYLIIHLIHSEYVIKLTAIKNPPDENFLLFGLAYLNGYGFCFGNSGTNYGLFTGVKGQLDFFRKYK